MIKPLRKFFFDDIRNAPDSSWTVAKDVDEAQKILSEQAFDVWSLDHDIRFMMMCEECGKELGPNPDDAEVKRKLEEGCTHYPNGTNLARWAVDNVKTWPELIVIHSQNPYGADRMHGILRMKTDCMILPFNVDALRSIRRLP